MATNRNLRFKTSRRFGVNIYGHPKALKRQVADARQKKQSEYGVQLAEKQKVKAMYNLLEKQFYRYYDKARRMSGVVGENLLFLLETRLDNLVYRAGFARSIRQARQMVTHGLINVDGKRVDIPSYRVKVGDVISLHENSKKSKKFEQIAEVAGGRVTPLWLEVNKEAGTAKVLRAFQREELDYDIAEHLIIELYSK